MSKEEFIKLYLQASDDVRNQIESVLEEHQQPPVPAE